MTSDGAVYPSLRHRRVFVTGGASGIGAAIVEAFWRQGCAVGLVDIDDAAAQSLSDRLKADEREPIWFRHVDAANAKELRRSIADFAEASGGLDVLVNNVANDTRHAALDVTEEDWRRCISLNMDSAFFASQEAIRRMRPADGGAIINISSINPILGLPNMIGYVSSKAAMLGMTKSLAREYGADNIRINAVLPGWVITQRQLDKWLTEEIERRWMESVALQERIMPEDVADLVVFLASDQSSKITGQSFVIDGGRT